MLDAVRRRNSTMLPVAAAGSVGGGGSCSSRMTASLSASASPPVITHTDATPQHSPNDTSSSTSRYALPQLLHCPSSPPPALSIADTAQSLQSVSHQQVGIDCV